MPAVQTELARPGISFPVLLGAHQLGEAETALGNRKVDGYLFDASQLSFLVLLLDQCRLLQGYKELANIGLSYLTRNAEAFAKCHADL
jgi:hypothetical protein